MKLINIYRQFQKNLKIINIDDHASQPSIFLYTLVLTGFFFFTEFSFFVQVISPYYVGYLHATNTPSVPFGIMPSILFAFSMQLILHFIYCVLVWYVARTVLIFFGHYFKNYLTVIIATWVVGIMTILLANQYYYPNSNYAELTAIFFYNQIFLRWAFFLFGMLSLFLLGFTLGHVILQIVKQLRKVPHSALIASITVLSLFYVALQFYDQPHQYAEPSSPTAAPNVILIGIDALRPDFLGYFASNNQTPFIDQWFLNATVFSEALTPIARTFPAWTSLLSGQYPRQHGVRYDLAKQDHIQNQAFLSRILQDRGYYTIYASDETRFSNIGVKYGFNQTATPPVGLKDFLIGTFNDFPMSNLLVNTGLGRILFPYNYGNRPASYTYDPDSFLNLIHLGLSKRLQHKPLFLAIHFCLPHFDYVWADYPGNRHTVAENYQASIHRVDQQVRKLFTMLAKEHLLDHAIVVILSDHGEALGFAGDRVTERDLYANWNNSNKHFTFFSSNNIHEKLNASGGHGNDVLGLSQYHSVLAFRLYGWEQDQNKNLIENSASFRGKQKIGQVSETVSLIDVKPTLLDLLGIKDTSKTSGISLMTSILDTGKEINKVKRHLFLESDFSPESVRTVHPEIEQVFLEGLQLFDIDPKTTYLTMKENVGKMAISSKQYADVYGEYILALYPAVSGRRMPILVNLNTGEWTDDMHSLFAKKSPFNEMWGALKKFYGNELTN